MESCAPQTPPRRPHFLHHRRMDSFPTDDTSELSLSLDEEDTGGFGMPESVSLGAFPVFLLQESPGSRKSIPQFPESPESSYGFAPAVTRTSPHTRLHLLGSISGDDDTSPDMEPRRHRPTDSWDSQLSTPTRPPRYESQTRLLSAKPSLLDFARSEEDETLVGHYDGGRGKKLRPVLSVSSTTSTTLASPLSDTFSPGPGSTSCSVSTSVSGSSCLDEFPTEVGGMASLDLEEPDRKIFTEMARELVNSASPLTVVQPNLELEPTLAQEASSPLLVPDVHTPPRPGLKHTRPSHPQTPKSSVSTSPSIANHRRAFSGARELVVPTSSSSGRLRSCSVNSDAAKRDLIEQAARSRSRSRSNSASASATLGGSSNGAARSLNSMQSKESFRTKFANLPGYVTFLREITLEIWIDQEGFRAIRPQFELHRYTPGQLTPGSQDHGRFLWKFEYLVEDRRASTGAVIPGEKILTPLTFSCAPELLIPEQGKKVGLLRVMKKSVIPKISASKLDPVLVPPITPGGNTSTAEEPAHTGKAKTFETLAKIVRHSSHSKSRANMPRHASTPSRQSPALGAHRTAGSEDATEDGHRRAASYSNMRPDLRQILGDGCDG
ncbi:hypothetical protein FRC08_011216 [Ceratobasidium sp. 394]|nr:hypothetical protein FRC08_011216 [Ceratobasidium sp. 394]